MHANVVAINVGRDMLGLGWVEREAKSPLNFFQKTVPRPTVLEEKLLQASALAVLAQRLGIAEQ
jgi:hypothetical protein